MTEVRIPDFAPFSAESIRALNEVIARSDERQRAWLSGFLAGRDAVETASAPESPARIPLTVLYATESGNAEALAYELVKRAKGQGFAARVTDAADAALTDLAESANLLVIASTWGEGDPPQRAEPFYQTILADDAPRFEGTRFAVLALGDSSYTQFCEVGKEIDRRLEELGGERIAECVACDLDYEDAAEAWSAAALERLLKQHDADGAVVVQPPPREQDVRVAAGASKERPFSAEITEIARLSGAQSSRETLHVELALDSSGIHFEPGDALGIHPENDPALVEEILKAVGLPADHSVGERLRRDFDITQLTRPVAQAFAAIRSNAALATLLDTGDFDGYRSKRQIIDLFHEFPQDLSAEEVLGLFRKLPPRLYSVASSLRAEPDTAHLLLSVVRYERGGNVRSGVTTGWVADRRKRGDVLPIYVKPNRHFRLPEDTDRPIIMIGPGTGVAPFRAFLQERRAVGAGGRTWLFFGERHFTHDFHYQLEWQELIAEGVLDRMDVAFSRDQREKIYVQHRLWEQRKELFRWLEDGAHLYVCGDERRMGKDVDAMLTRIVAAEGGWDSERASAYLAELRSAGRYQRDLY